MDRQFRENREKRPMLSAFFLDFEDVLIEVSQETTIQIAMYSGLLSTFYSSSIATNINIFT